MEQMLLLPPRSYQFPCLPSMRKDYGTGIPALLRPLRAMPGLECLLQSNDDPASEITPSATYFPIRPASSTRWPLLACPFSPSQIFFISLLTFYLQTLSFIFGFLAVHADLGRCGFQRYIYCKWDRGICHLLETNRYCSLLCMITRDDKIKAKQDNSSWIGMW